MRTTCFSPLVTSPPCRFSFFPSFPHPFIPAPISRRGRSPISRFSANLMDISRRDTLFPSAKVFCNPDILAFLQTSPYRPFDDSKTLVDLELGQHPDQVLKEFYNLPQNPTEEQYNSFLNSSFKQIDPEYQSLLQPAKPPDYTTQVPSRMVVLSKTHPHLLNFVLDLKLRWADLCRTFPADMVPTDGDPPPTSYSSLIPLPHPFFVPGGRFRECYYWDTLWIAKGLIACDMVRSAQNAVRNLLYLVRILGFVPNGNRVYYLNRSQPPTLTESVLLIFNALPNIQERIDWLKEALPALDKEYENFASSHSIANVHTNFRTGKEVLSVYTVDTADPRPESFKEDVATLKEKLKQNPSLGSSEDARSRLFQNLAAGAESGWDYSSRFFINDGTDMEDITTQDIVPCCLNSILLKAERDLAKFHDILATSSTMMGDTLPNSGEEKEIVESHMKMRAKYRESAKNRQESMMKNMWSQKEAFWFDLDATNGRHTNIVSVAGIMPAWAGCWEGYWTPADAERFVTFVMNTSGLVRPGGLSCTTTTSEQQWDFPNCWPPLVDFAVAGMQRVAAKFPESGAGEAAEEIARRFTRSTYSGWRRDRQMHEKYDCRYDSGERGVGGEYLPQTGFGWTNGTVLWVLREYSDLISETGDNSWG